MRIFNYEICVMSTFNSLSQTDLLEAKTNQLEIKLTAQIADLKSKMTVSPFWDV